MFDGDPDFHRLTFVLCCLQWPGLDLGKGRKLNSQHFVIDTALDVLAAQKTLLSKEFLQKKGCLDKETCRKLFGATR